MIPQPAPYSWQVKQPDARLSAVKRACSKGSTTSTCVHAHGTPYSTATHHCLRHAGEDDAHGFGGVFSAAWHGRALKVYASGSNLLPTIHVSDLAAYVTALLASCAADTDWASASPIASTSTSPANTTLRSLATFGHTTATVAAAAAAAGAGAAAAGTGSLGALGQYLLVADPKAVSQRDLVSAVSKALGCGQVKEAALGQLLLGSQQVSPLAATFTVLAGQAACCMMRALLLERSCQSQHMHSTLQQWPLLAHAAHQ
jgi:hypothetical protein